MTTFTIENITEALGRHSRTKLGSRGWDETKSGRVAEDVLDRLPSAGGSGRWRVVERTPLTEPGPLTYEVERKDGANRVFESESRVEAEVVADALNDLQNVAKT